jgi:hypothetical protein
MQSFGLVWKVIYFEDTDDTDSAEELAEKRYTLPSGAIVSIGT